MLGVAVIGTGNIGTDHVRRLAHEVVGSAVVAVFDVDAERAARVARSVGAVSHSSAADAVADVNVDAVLVASPGAFHTEVNLASIAVGKPVLCEKPLAITAEDCVRVLEAEEEAGRRLVQVGFMRRYDKGYRAVKAALDGGSIGEALVAHCVHRNVAAPDEFTSEMSITDSAIHEIDAARWLFGQEIVAATVVTARQSPLVAENLRDPLLILLEMANGAVVDVEVFANCKYGYDVRCEVVGSHGTASLEIPLSVSLTRNREQIHPVPADWRERFDAAYLDELQQWVAGVSRGRVGGPSAWDGYAANAVAEQCVNSLHRGGRAEITLRDRPALYT